MKHGPCLFSRWFLGTVLWCLCGHLPFAALGYTLTPPAAGSIMFINSHDTNFLYKISLSTYLAGNGDSNGYPAWGIGPGTFGYGGYSPPASFGANSYAVTTNDPLLIGTIAYGPSAGQIGFISIPRQTISVVSPFLTFGHVLSDPIQVAAFPLITNYQTNVYWQQGYTRYGTNFVPNAGLGPGEHVAQQCNYASLLHQYGSAVTVPQTTVGIYLMPCDYIFTNYFVSNSAGQVTYNSANNAGWHFYYFINGNWVSCGDVLIPSSVGSYKYDFSGFYNQSSNYLYQPTPGIPAQFTYATNGFEFSPTIFPLTIQVPLGGIVDVSTTFQFKVVTDLTAGWGGFLYPGGFGGYLYTSNYSKTNIYFPGPSDFSFSCYDTVIAGGSTRVLMYNPPHNSTQSTNDDLSSPVIIPPIITSMVVGSSTSTIKGIGATAFQPVSILATTSLSTTWYNQVNTNADVNGNFNTTFPSIPTPILLTTNITFAGTYITNLVDITTTGLSPPQTGDIYSNEVTYFPSNTTNISYGSVSLFFKGLFQ